MSFLTISKYLNKLNPPYDLLFFDDLFQSFWFRNKGSENAKARALIQTEHWIHCSCAYGLPNF